MNNIENKIINNDISKRFNKILQEVKNFNLSTKKLTLKQNCYNFLKFENSLEKVKNFFDIYLFNLNNSLLLSIAGNKDEYEKIYYNKKKEGDVRYLYNFLEFITEFNEKILLLHQDNIFENIKFNIEQTLKKIEEIKNNLFIPYNKELVLDYIFYNKNEKKVLELFENLEFVYFITTNYFLLKCLENNLKDFEQIENFMKKVPEYYANLYNFKKFKLYDNNDTFLIRGITIDNELYELEISYYKPFRLFNYKKFDIKTDKEKIKRIFDKYILKEIPAILKI